jgi:hypothetical protein
MRTSGRPSSSASHSVEASSSGRAKPAISAETQRDRRF